MTKDFEFECESDVLNGCLKGFWQSVLEADEFVCPDNNFVREDILTSLFYIFFDLDS